MRKVGGAVNSAKISRVCLQMLIICPLVEISTIYWKDRIYWPIVRDVYIFQKERESLR